MNKNTKRQLYSLLSTLLYFYAAFSARYIVRGRYAKQLLLAIAVIFAFLALRSFFALTRKPALRLITLMFDKLKSTAGAIGSRIRKLLGLPPKGVIRSKNEKKDTFTFIKRDRGARKKKKEYEKKKKWNDLSTSSEKIRYLYSGYVNWLIKRGLIFHSSLSPNEILSGAPDGDKMPELIDVYDNVRYSASPEERAQSALSGQLEQAEKYMGDRFVKKENKEMKKSR